MASNKNFDLRKKENSGKLFSGTPLLLNKKLNVFEIKNRNFRAKRSKAFKRELISENIVRILRSMMDI